MLGLQMPSASNPNRTGPDIGSAAIACDELFCTPISESSEPSKGGWAGSCWTVGAPVFGIVIRNWQPESRATGGHWLKTASAPEGASASAQAASTTAETIRATERPVMATP